MNETDISQDIKDQLATFDITTNDEIALRILLEEHVATYTLIKLAAWPARRWKCHYRLMMRDQMIDAQSVPEAYALALLAVLRASRDT